MIMIKKGLIQFQKILCFLRIKDTNSKLKANILNLANAINIHWYAQGTLGQKGTLLSLRP